MRLVLAVALLSILTVVPPTVSAPAERANRIAYLHLRKAGDTITLDSMRVVPGKLKVPRQPAQVKGHLQVSVQNEWGEPLSRSTLADPSHLRLEYVDEQGRLQTLVERRDTVRFTVRVPYTEATRSVAFHRIDHGLDAAASPPREYRALGVVLLPKAVLADE